MSPDPSSHRCSSYIFKTWSPTMCCSHLTSFWRLDFTVSMSQVLLCPDSIFLGLPHLQIHRLYYSLFPELFVPTITFELCVTPLHLCFIASFAEEISLLVPVALIPRRGGLLCQVSSQYYFSMEPFLSTFSSMWPLPPLCFCTCYCP